MKVTASDAQTYGVFGHSVSISGEVALIGAYEVYGGDGDPNNLAATGAAYIFQLENGVWVEKQELTASDAQKGDAFGREVSISGNVAIVGALDEDGEIGNPDVSHDGPGAVYIFHHENGQWVEKQKLTASDAQVGDSFGESVAISGNRAIVGARHEDGSIGDPGEPFDGPGAAYIFHFENGQWQEEQKLTASDAQSRDFFGYSAVSISGDVAIVGAWGEDGGPGDPNMTAGAAYIFHFENGQWAEKQKLTALDEAQSAHVFGESVAISGDVAIVGAFGNAVDTGAAYIFHFENGQWVEKKQLAYSDAQAADLFVESVAISGNRAIVGAWDLDDGAGAAYIF